MTPELLQCQLTLTEHIYTMSPPAYTSEYPKPEFLEVVDTIVWYNFLFLTWLMFYRGYLNEIFSGVFFKLQSHDGFPFTIITIRHTQTYNMYVFEDY